jgi:predicted  nucleic acid-binding Zn-ribbon protein
MAEEADNLVLEHLRHIRRVVDTLEADMGVVKSRITAFEGTMGHVMAQIGHPQAQIASQTGRIDRIEERLGRIEQRLDLAHV